MQAYTATKAEMDLIKRIVNSHDPLVLECLKHYLVTIRGIDKVVMLEEIEEI